MVEASVEEFPIPRLQAVEVAGTGMTSAGVAGLKEGCPTYR
jgi:hypothetical protein